MRAQHVLRYQTNISTLLKVYNRKLGNGVLLVLTKVSQHPSEFTPQGKDWKSGRVKTRYTADKKKEEMVKRKRESDIERKFS